MVILCTTKVLKFPKIESVMLFIVINFNKNILVICIRKFKVNLNFLLTIFSIIFESRTVLIVSSKFIEPIPQNKNFH